jgi:hypothetical protein
VQNAKYRPPQKQKTRCRVTERVITGSKSSRRLLLPSALLVAIGLQALFALVLVHLQTAFLFEVTHVVSGLD